MAIDHEAIFANSEEVAGREIAASSGEIPRALEGSFVRNGPGAFSVGAHHFNFFDGWGMVTTVGFREGRARLTSRFVETPTYREERAAGRQTRRRAFANVAGVRSFMNPNLANACMHDAFFFGGRLYATDDPGHYRLDPQTLATMGEDRFDGRVPKGQTMCAVPRFDPSTDRMVFYSVKPNPFGRDTIRYLEMDRAWNVAREVRHQLPHGFAFPHEVAFTERFYVVPVPPRKLDLLGVLLGRKPVIDCFARLDKPTVVQLLPRDGRGEPVTVPLPGDIEAFFHVANAYEDGDAIVLDGASYPWTDFSCFASNEAREAWGRPLVRGPSAVFRRYRIDAKRAQVTEVKDHLARAELPRIHRGFSGKRHRFAYLVATATPNGAPDPFVWPSDVAKVDCDSGAVTLWHAGAHRFASQPVFAPTGAGEDEGLVLASLVNVETRRAELVILDARRLDAGPIATLDLGVHIGLASHCRFEPELLPAS